MFWKDKIQSLSFNQSYMLSLIIMKGLVFSFKSYFLILKIRIYSAVFEQGMFKLLSILFISFDPHTSGPLCAPQACSPQLPLPHASSIGPVCRIVPKLAIILPWMLSWISLPEDLEIGRTIIPCSSLANRGTGELAMQV